MQYNVNTDAPVSYTMLHSIVDTVNDVSSRLDRLENAQGENPAMERMFAQIGRDAFWADCTVLDCWPTVTATRLADGSISFEPKLAKFAEGGILVSEVARRMSMPEFMQVYGERIAELYADAQNAALAKLDEETEAASVAEVA